MQNEPLLQSYYQEILTSTAESRIIYLMDYYAGIDISLEASSLCLVDATGKTIRETKVASDPDALIDHFASLGFALKRIGLEAGPLSQCLHEGLRRLASMLFCWKRVT